MRSTITLGRIRGIELGLHFSWIIIALLITFSLAAQFHFSNPEWSEATTWISAVVTGLLFFAALFAHELSHAFVARLRGLPIRRITLFLFGGMAQMEKEAADANTEFLVSIAGPIMSVVLGLACLGLAFAFGWMPRAIPVTPFSAVLVWLGYINLTLAAFNMIPGFPLDGGRVLRAIIWAINRDEHRATTIAARVGQVVALLFIAFGLQRMFLGGGMGGLWIAFIGWFLLQAAGASYAHARSTGALAGMCAADILTRDCETVSADLAVRDFVHNHLLRSDRRVFVVVDNREMRGLVTPEDIQKVRPELWGALRLRDVMSPLDHARTVTPEMPATEALRLMDTLGISEVPVVHNGRLEGILTRKRLSHALLADEELKAA